MNDTPKVSIVIPCFNHGEFLHEAVDSVLNANRSDVELIVVDDGSTDERTQQEMHALETGRIRLIRQENKGLSAARNAGIRASTGQYILPLDADNRIRPAYIEHGVRMLDANPEVGIVYSDRNVFGMRPDRWVAGPFDLRRLMQSNYIDACAVFRRAVWEQIGGYDENMKQGFEDWEFWLSAYERGWQFAYIPEPLFDYRQRENSMLAQARKIESSVAEYMAAKHAALYRRECVQLALEHDSGRATIRNLGRIVKTRIKQKLRLNQDNAGPH